MWAFVRENHKNLEENLKHLYGRMDVVEVPNSDSFDRLESLTKENEKFKETLIYVQSQSKCNNLVFCNIDEAHDS